MHAPRAFVPHLVLQLCKMSLDFHLENDHYNDAGDAGRGPMRDPGLQQPVVLNVAASFKRCCCTYPYYVCSDDERASARFPAVKLER